MSNKFIPLSVPNLKGNEKKYMDEAIDKEWVSTAGSFVSGMEKQIAEYVKMPEAVACQSGTAALHLCLMACNVQEGDEVIVPTLTFIASVNPVCYQKAWPVFMDCDDSLCMDMDKLEQFLREETVCEGGVLKNKKTGRRIAAVLVVHVFGNMADMEKLMDLKAQYGFTVIEDACEALGTFYTAGRYKGKAAGTIGDMGAYSFNGNKIVTTGGGGMIVANDEEKLHYTRYLSTQAKDDLLYYVHNNIGYNYRLTNIQAALGVAQLEQLEKFVKAKEKWYNRYQELGIKLLSFRSDIRSNKWFYSYMTDRRDDMIKFMQENDIQTRPVWHLIHDLKPYLDCQNYKIEKALEYYRQIVNIPCSTNLSDEDVCRVAEKIKEFNR